MGIKIIRKKGNVDIEDVKSLAKALEERNVTIGVHKEEGQAINSRSETKVIDYACYNEFGGNKGDNPPARPFVRIKQSEELRNAIKLWHKKIKNTLYKSIKGKVALTAKRLYEEVGKLYMHQMWHRLQFSSQFYNGNAPRTIEQKGFDHPLVDTMLLFKSLRYKVNKQ